MHGISVLVDADSELFVEAVREMMYYFVVDKVDSSALKFSFRSLSFEELDKISVPSKVAAVSEDMEYFFSYPCIFIRGRGKFTSVIDIEKMLVTSYAEHGLLKNSWLLAHQVFYPAFSELLKENALFEMHCATLSKDGKGYLFPAKTGSGKSTTTLSLLLENFEFLSDDVTFIRERDGKPELLCFPEPVQMWEESYNFFPQIKARLSKKHSCKFRKQSFLVEEMFPKQLREAVLADYLFLPSVDKGGKCRIEPISQKEALVELIPQGLITVNPRIVKKNLSLLSCIVRSCQCFRLFLGKDIGNLASILP